MPTFPTLTVNPVFPIKEEREDATIRSDTEGGYQQTRARHTRNRRTFPVQYQNMPAADKSTLDTFITTVKCGADIFTWTHPDSGVTYSVRFSKIPVFSLVHKNRYDVEFTVMEV